MNMDGRETTVNSLARETGLSVFRIRVAIRRHAPATMADLKDAVRKDLCTPVEHKPHGGSLVWAKRHGAQFRTVEQLRAKLAQLKVEPAA